MVRASKPTTPTSTVPVVAETPEVKAPAAKKPKTPKNTLVDTSNPIVMDVVSDPPALDTPTILVVDESIATKMTAFNNALQQLTALLVNIKSQYKSLEKFVTKEMKASQKASSKKSKRSGNRQPSGFVRPTLISDELATFLNKPSGTEMARTSVSKEINEYIRNNSLQDPANGRQINADAKLATLLKLTTEDVLTYFNLQKFMKIHFCKMTPTVPLVPVDAPIAV